METFILFSLVQCKISKLNCTLLNYLKKGGKKRDYSLEFSQDNLGSMQIVNINVWKMKRPRYLSFHSYFTIMLVFWNCSQLFSYHSWELKCIPELCGNRNCIFTQLLGISSQADYQDSLLESLSFASPVGSWDPDKFKGIFFADHINWLVSAG